MSLEEKHRKKVNDFCLKNNTSVVTLGNKSRYKHGQKLQEFYELKKGTLTLAVASRIEQTMKNWKK